MKKVFVFLMATVIILTSCGMNKTSHEAQWSPDGKDSVVYVNYRNEDGSLTQFYMNYLLFHTLFNQGGYSNCYNYYRNNQTAFYNNDRYSSYSRVYSPSYRSSESSSSSRSYSSPSRSSNSYSSPSRSYSSPSRSYSSPSRSYSSPSRSYSSPSRSSSFHH